MLILVTGGAGFIGSHLCERLVHDGHSVISLDNNLTGMSDNRVNKVDYRFGHTKDIERLVPESPDLVYHLGEYARVEKSFEDIARVWDSNMMGTFSVLEFCKKRACKIVYAGSSTKFAAGGFGREQSPYAWTKASNTELVKNYGAWYGVPYVITYFYNVYGGRERGSGPYATLIGILKEQYKNGQPLTIVAPGTQKRNFTHIEDTVEGLVLAGEHGEGDEYGIGNDNAYSVIEIANLFGSDVVMLPERKGNRDSSPVDTEKIRALGWTPKRSIVDHVQEFVASTKREVAPERRVLVFSTTFHPVSGPAEEALCDLMRSMPDLHFDVITTYHVPEARDAICPVPNATLYRVGWGNSFDKFLLPFVGARIAGDLSKKHQYLFSWSLMASYGALAAGFFKRNTKLPLLITLADQSLGQVPWYMRLVLRHILGQADQVYASTSEQEAQALSIAARANLVRSVGAGDAFANAMRFAYAGFLAERLHTKK